MTLGGNGDSSVQTGGAIHIYVANTFHAEALLLECGRRVSARSAAGSPPIFTELGKIEVAPGEICVLPRGLQVSGGVAR